MRMGVLLFLLLPAILFLPLVAIAQTQTDMDVDSCSKYKAADTQLNSVYRKILRKKKGDAVFLNAFRKAERAWIAYRDAEVEAVFPAKDKQGQYGSVYPMCNCDLLASLTEQRVKELSEWLTSQEGDVCAGSQ